MIESIVIIILALICLFAAVVFHEFAHGWIAYQLGDPTAKMDHRLTLNPLPHIDLFGTIIVPAMLVLLSLITGSALFIIGWAKPVPINPRYFKKPYKGMMLVGLAGPLTNLALALVGTILWKLFTASFKSAIMLDSITGIMLKDIGFMLGMFVIINVILAVFNLIPVPPLDGSRILTYLLPPEGKRIMHSLEPYGFLIIIGLLWFGLLQQVIRPIFLWVMTHPLGKLWIYIATELNFFK